MREAAFFCTLEAGAHRPQVMQQLSAKLLFLAELGNQGAGQRLSSGGQRFDDFVRILLGHDGKWLRRLRRIDEDRDLSPHDRHDCLWMR